MCGAGTLQQFQPRRDRRRRRVARFAVIVGQRLMEFGEKLGRRR